MNATLGRWGLRFLFTAGGLLAVSASLAYADQGTQGQGDPHLVIRQVIRQSPPAPPLEITGRSVADATNVLELAVPEGGWLIDAQVDAGRDEGGGTVICVTRIAPGLLATLGRASLGADPGNVQRATISASGAFDAGPGGVTLRLQCRQRDDSVGPNPFVFLASIVAQPVAQIVEP